MAEYKYASWVKGEYLNWANKEQRTVDYPCGVKHFIEDPFKNDPVYTFLSREDSKPKLTTLKSISNLCVLNGGYEYSVLKLAANLLHYMETYGFTFRSAKKKEVSSSLKQFRKATDNLFDSISNIYGNNPLDLIDGVPRNFLGRFFYPDAESNLFKDLISALDSFQKKTTHQILVEFSDTVEQLGTGNPYFLVNNRAPTENQMRVRILVKYLIKLIGFEPTKDLRGLAPLITHLVDIRSTEPEPLCPRDVSRQIKTALTEYDNLYRGAEVKKLPSTP